MQRASTPAKQSCWRQQIRRRPVHREMGRQRNTAFPPFIQANHLMLELVLQSTILLPSIIFQSWEKTLLCSNAIRWSQSIGAANSHDRLRNGAGTPSYLTIPTYSSNTTLVLVVSESLSLALGNVILDCFWFINRKSCSTTKMLVTPHSSALPATQTEVSVRHSPATWTNRNHLPKDSPAASQTQPSTSITVSRPE